MEREILLIGAGVICATLLLTQSSAVAESFASILKAIAQFAYALLCAVGHLVAKTIEIFIKILLSPFSNGLRDDNRNSGGGPNEN